MTGDNGSRPPLCSEFPPNTYAEWLAKAAQDVGRDRLERLTWDSDDGIQVNPLFERRDLEGLAHMAPGISQVLREKRAGRVRQLIREADPTHAERVSAEALAGGAHELLIKFDRLVRHGADPGTIEESDEERDLYPFEAGQDGCSAYHSDDLARVLGQVDLTETPLAIEAGAASLGVLGMLFHIADHRGVDRHDLRIDLGLDPISEVVAGRSPGKSVAALLEEVVAAANLARPWPGVRPLCVHSSAFHRAGATPVDEVACSIATAIEYIRALVGAGLGIEAATGCITLRVQIDTDIIFESAKLRATRLLWAKIVQAFGGQQYALELHVEGSERSFSSEDVHTNLLRSTLQAVIANFAGFDSLSLTPHTQTHDASDSLHQSLVRSQQVLLREESHLHRVRDTCGGSYAIEKLTDDLARRAWSFVQEIEAGGGVIAALNSGLIQKRLNASAERRREDIQTRRRTLVGVNKFVDAGATTEAALLDPRATVTAHLEFLQRREAPTRVLDRVSPDDLESLVNAAAAGCTVGEMTRALRGGEYADLEHPFYESSSDGAAFEQLRTLVAGDRIRVVPLLVGSPELSRKYHSFARDLFLAGGFEVSDPLGADSSLDNLENDIVALCGEERACAEILPRVCGTSLVVAIGREHSKLAGRVHEVIEEDGNAYLTLRSLFLATRASREADR